jgi:hypothetical protein
VRDALNKLEPPPKPDDWYNRLPTDLRLAVSHRFEDSELQPDHVFSLAFLRAAKSAEGSKFTDTIQRFAVDALTVPLCVICNRGRGARLYETESELLQRWADYRFGGDVAAARIHPEFRMFEYLARLAYETNLVADVDAATRQRRRRA